MEKYSNDEMMQAENDKLKNIINNLQGKLGQKDVYIAELEVNNNVLFQHIENTKNVDGETSDTEELEGVKTEKKGA